MKNCWIVKLLSLLFNTTNKYNITRVEQWAKYFNFQILFCFGIYRALLTFTLKERICKHLIALLRSTKERVHILKRGSQKLRRLKKVLMEDFLLLQRSKHGSFFMPQCSQEKGATCLTTTMKYMTWCMKIRSYSILPNLLFLFSMKCSLCNVGRFS